MAKLKKPGRVTVECVKCQKKFSTHSTNRTHCHTCVPKTEHKRLQWARYTAPRA